MVGWGDTLLPTFLILRCGERVLRVLGDFWDRGGGGIIEEGWEEGGISYDQ